MAAKKRIRFYNSVEEMEQASIAYALSQAPAERIRETVELILRGLQCDAGRSCSQTKKQKNKVYESNIRHYRYSHIRWINI